MFHLQSMTHYRHQLIALLLHLLVATLLFGDQAGRPNIVLIMADDIGYECFGSYGSTQYKTPNIDRMAAEGMRFTHCYSQPLCTPSRVKIMTGVSNVRNYSCFSVLNRDQRTIGQYFTDAGYATAIAGKWQLYGAEHYSEKFRGKGSLPADVGFDRMCLWQVDRLGSRFWKPLLFVDGTNRQFEDNDYGPHVVNQFVLRFMEEHAGKAHSRENKPFFVYYPMILVHSPFIPTPDSESRESKDKQKNFEDMVAYMDRMVGNVVKKTQDLGIAENTLIIFTGDNGTHRNIRSQLRGTEIRGGKGLTTDAGTRVPLVALWPGTIPQGKINETLIEFSDFLPTTLAAAKISKSTRLDGQSFFPQLQGERGKPREHIFCYYNPRPEKTKPIRFVRNQQFKLYGDGRFFNVANDVLEQKDLSRSKLTKELSSIRLSLNAALDQYPAVGQSLLRFSP